MVIAQVSEDVICDVINKQKELAEGLLKLFVFYHFSGWDLNE